MPQFSRPLALCLGLAALSPFVQAAASPAAGDALSVPVAEQRPRVALVLSGGGARGAAHVGVLRVLEEMRVPIDLIVGTSAGAVVGGLYASGMSPDEITVFLTDLDWDRALTDRPPRRNLSFRRKEDDARYLTRLEIGYRNGRLYLPRGLIAGQNVNFLLKTQTLDAAAIERFDDLPIPFRAIATDIETGEMVVLDHGDLALAMRASMSVPGAFAPVEVDGRLLVDGGLVRNLPVDVARSLGADVVIAVNVATPLAARDELADVVGLSIQVINVLTLQNVADSVAALTERDVLIQPELRTVEASAFRQIRQAIASGISATRAAAARLAPLAIAPEKYQHYLDRQRGRNREPPVIDFIEVVGNERVATEVISSRVRTASGQPLDLDVLAVDLERVYAIGDFENVNFSIVERDGTQGLRILVREKAWGPHYLKFGLNVMEDFEGGSAYDLLFNHTLTNVNDLAGEWKTDVQLGETRALTSEFFQPLNTGGNWFLAPEIFFTSTTFDLFSGSERLAEYRSRRAGVALDAGWQPDNVGEIRIGVSRAKADAEKRIGDSGLPDLHDELGQYRFEATIDQIDSIDFPRQGFYARLSGEFARSALGSEIEYDKMGFEVTGAISGSRNTLVLSAEYGTSRESDLPLYDQYALGGFLSLSGMRQGQLRGDAVAAMRLIYMGRLYKLSPLVGDALYAGLSVEFGNVWAKEEDIDLKNMRSGNALFVGSDTVLGPLLIGFGYAEGGNRAIYLSLGRGF